MKDCRECGADGFVKEGAEPIECKACQGHGEIECYKGEHKEASEWQENREAIEDYYFGDDHMGPYPNRDKKSRFYI